MWAWRRALGNALCVIILGLLLGSRAAEPVHAAEAAQPIRAHLSDLLAGDAGPAGPGDGALEQALATFYATRGHIPAWVGESGPRPGARQLLEVLRNADAEGLRPRTYGVEAITALMEAEAPATLAALELRLSRALLSYTGDLRHGRLTPGLVAAHPAAGEPRLDAATVLAEAAASEDAAAYVAGLAPANPNYRHLRRALERYRDIAAAGGWPAIPPGPALKEGVRDPAVATLRRHLRATGDLSVPSHDPALFDAALAQAVRGYQARHGLETDGVVGPRTRAQLAVPVAERIRQIEVNMERWRWMPDDLGSRYVLVNLAGYEVELVEHGATTLRMRAVVGLPYRKTPVFSDRITYVELNPTWTVPPTIMRKDLIPKIRADADYLARENFRVYVGWSGSAPPIDPAAIDWQALDPADVPYRFVQAPGPRNPLGQVKFMFPNRFHVYLHDTPQPELFEHARRTFSSGCIRIEKPMQLLDRLLAPQREWDRARVERVLADGRTTRVPLAEPLAIHITYSTAWIDEEGTIHFRDDVYGRDALIDQALAAIGLSRTAADFSSPYR